MLFLAADSSFSNLVFPHSWHLRGLQRPSLVAPQLVHFQTAIFYLLSSKACINYLFKNYLLGVSLVRFLFTITAFTGQTSAQRPQSLHFRWRISYTPLFSTTAQRGHSSAQRPQPMHCSSRMRWLIYFRFILPSRLVCICESPDQFVRRIQASGFRVLD